MIFTSGISSLLIQIEHSSLFLRIAYSSNIIFKNIYLIQIFQIKLFYLYNDLEQELFPFFFVDNFHFFFEIS